MGDGVRYCEECCEELELNVAENRVPEPDKDRLRDYRNRWACDVLEEMRKILEARIRVAGRDSHSSKTLWLLVEELQSMCSRMEAALNYKKNVERWRKECKKMETKLLAIQQEAYDLGLLVDKQKHNSLDND